MYLGKDTGEKKLASVLGFTVTRLTRRVYLADPDNANWYDGATQVVYKVTRHGRTIAVFPARPVRNDGGPVTSGHKITRDPSITWQWDSHSHVAD
jgi:hypothetical protein